MSCIFGISKENRHNCKFCNVAYCDERPEEFNTISATQHEAQQRIQKGEVSTVHELMRKTKVVINQLSSDHIPIKLNGRRIKILKVELMEDPDYGYCENIKFKFDEPVIS